MSKYFAPMIVMIPLLLLCGVVSFAANDYPSTPDSCEIIGEPQNRVVTLADGLGTAIISMVPVQLKSKTMGFSWMDGDGLVTSSESIQSVTDKKRKERDERSKPTQPEKAGA